jgi:3D (Asp-Asp-Asp) domain-containing protein
MQTVMLALTGFLAFSGAPATDTLAQAPFAEAVASTTTLAIADRAHFVLADASESEPLTVKLTSYNAVPEQTDGDPHVTASGAYSNHEVVAARSVDLKETLPFGTVIEITRDGTDSENCRFAQVEHLIGYRVVADSMHSRKRAQIDVLLDQTDTVQVHGEEINPALALGVCTEVTVKVVGRLKVRDIPETQAELVELVKGSHLAKR